LTRLHGEAFEFSLRQPIDNGTKEFQESDMLYQDYQTLKIDRSGKILTVAFNRPEVRNATNARMHQELERVFPEIGKDPDTHVVILTGVGKSFSAGGDIESMSRQVDDHARWNESMSEARRILFNLVDLDRPVIARINGHAVGLGATLALFCDITIAVETARIADPHVKVGLVAGDGGALIWPLLAGYARTKHLLLTGEAITCAQAAQIGLITEAVKAEDLDARVAALANSIAEGATVAVRGTKRALNVVLRSQLQATIDAHLGLETMSHLSDDHREAVNAFAADRPPTFKGT
jgi:enoyl-CoA hydratase